MELQNTVKEALHALYHHPDDAVRMQADRWLQEFQRTLDAWQVADNLLHDPTSNMETLIFCSQTLRSKVQRDFEELPSEAFRPLRDSLTSLLNKFHHGPPKVRTQISLAVAALAVHVSVQDWGDGGIMTWLNNQMKAHPECVPSFLELLKVLPEEVFNYRISARPERRRQFEKELTSSMEVAFSLLTACLNASELKEQVLEAFASWLRLRRGISPSLLASHPLALTALSSLSSDILSEASVNVVSELIHCSAVGNPSDASVQLPLIQIIVPQVMNLRPLLNDPSKDEEYVKAIGRLFADMGDSYVKLIATGTDESMMIVNALLEVASHPEFDIASMTFNFWHNLQIFLIERDLYLSFGNEASIEMEMNRRLQIFRSSYETLVSLVSSRVQYPDDYMELSREDLKDFKQTRYAVADVLVDAALVLGGDTVLKILYMKLAQAVTSCGNNQSSDWRPAEAALYCIRAIAESVSSMEMEVMPQTGELYYINWRTGKKVKEDPRTTATGYNGNTKPSNSIASPSLPPPALPPLSHVLSLPPPPVSMPAPAMAQSATVGVSSVLPVQNSELIEEPSPVLEEALPLSPPIAIVSTGINGSYSSSSSCNSVSSVNTSSSVFASLFASSTAPSTSTLPSNPNPGYSDFIQTMGPPECPPRELPPPSSSEMISLCLATSHGSSIFAPAGQECRQYAAPAPQPAMSATALLQKAAQIGAAGGGSLLRGLGLMSSGPSSGPSETFPWAARQVKPENSPVTSGIGLGLRCDEGSGLKELMIGSSSMSNQPTLDFLGLMTSIGGGLDMSAASSYQGGEFSGNNLGGNS